VIKHHLVEGKSSEFHRYLGRHYGIPVVRVIVVLWNPP
jgi:hypothetical protein